MKILSDAQWEAIKSILPIPPSPRRGRPRANPREVFETILFVLMTGMPWGQLPDGCPPKSTVYDYFRFWSRSQAFKKLMKEMVRQLAQKGRIDPSLCFIDAMFVPAKRGGQGVGRTKRGKGVKVQVVVDRQGLPVAATVASADTGEPQMVQGLLPLFPEEAQPEKIVGDKAYDADWLDEVLARLGIEMIAPHRKNRRPENKTQDGRKLKSYKKRWIVERTLAWLQNFRRVLVRYERSSLFYQSFVFLACLMILLKRFPFL